jgi:hypothetical protein
MRSKGGTPNGVVHSSKNGLASVSVAGSCPVQATSTAAKQIILVDTTAFISASSQGSMTRRRRAAVTRDDARADGGEW